MCGSRWRGVWGGGLSDDGSQGGTISIRLMCTYLKFLLLHIHSFFLLHILLVLHITCAHSIEQWETRNDAKVDQINRILKVHRICGRQFLCVKELKNNKIYRMSVPKQSTSRNVYELHVKEKEFISTIVNWRVAAKTLKHDWWNVKKWKLRWCGPQERIWRWPEARLPPGWPQAWELGE